MFFSTHADLEAPPPMFTWTSSFLEIPGTKFSENRGLWWGDHRPGPSAIWVKGNGKAPGIQAGNNSEADPSHGSS